jgi:DNA-binding transcriptional LysR family regulator
MELRHLTTFQAVVRQGSFLGAAREFGCAQSTITLHVQQLEAALGVELFDRSARRVRLTEAGRALQEQVASLLSRVEALRTTMAEVAHGETGHVRLGCIEPAASHRLPPVLARFCRERPHVRLSVELGGTEAIARRVARGELDAGICSRPESAFGLSFKPVFREPMGLLVPSGHPLAVADEVRLADLAGHRLLVTEQACAYRQLVEGALRLRDVAPTFGIEIASVQALIWAVRAGLGVAIVPALAATPVPEGAILRAFADLDLALTVGLVRPLDAPPPGRALAALLDACRRQFARLETGPFGD